jgi:hypothetical protein
LPSASVSTRTIVPPGTFALAAAVTLLSASPVTGVSSLRCRPHDCPVGGADWLPDAIGRPPLDSADESLEPEPLAALAMP